jgi:hypothetical protein
MTIGKKVQTECWRTDHNGTGGGHRESVLAGVKPLRYAATPLRGASGLDAKLRADQLCYYCRRLE